MKDVLVASLEMVLIVTSLEEARDAAEHPPQDTPTAKITQLRMSVVQRWRSAVENTS